MTIQDYKNLLDYNPETGIFTHKSSKKTGLIAGSKYENGYIRIRIKNKRVMAHRLAFAFINNKWPSEQIDHINGNRSDNRIANLREASPLENCRNMEIHRQGRLVGASFHKASGLYRSQVKYKRKYIHLGFFKTELEAHKAYVSFYDNLALTNSDCRYSG